LRQVINHPECSLMVVVRFPLITQTRLFGEFSCQWQVRVLSGGNLP
jgi:hypothetical protein